MAKLSYPLGAASRGAIQTVTGKKVSEITIEAALAGELDPRDVAVAPETLLLQATFAEEGGNPQLAENLRRGAELVALSKTRRCAVMCAETVWWRCHRRIIADYLLAAGQEVLHILGPGHIAAASLTPGAIVRADARVVYPA